MDERYHIRFALTSDVPALAAIERRCFSDPWSARGIEETIQYETTIALIAEARKGVAGYLLARVSGDEGEILNLAVVPEHRRKGIARDLLERGIAALREAGVREAYLEVRESNAAALALYGGQGFKPVAVRPHYYRSPPEDALILRSPIGLPQK
jgi:ribosomal-protein-alanine N-acetyltransferase